MLGNFDELDRKSLDCLEEMVGRTMDIKGLLQCPDSGEGSDGSEEQSRESFYYLRE